MKGYYLAVIPILLLAIILLIVNIKGADLESELESLSVLNEKLDEDNIKLRLLTIDLYRQIENLQWYCTDCQGNYETCISAFQGCAERYESCIFGGN